MSLSVIWLSTHAQSKTRRRDDDNDGKRVSMEQSRAIMCDILTKIAKSVKYRWLRAGRQNDGQTTFSPCDVLLMLAAKKKKREEHYLFADSYYVTLYQQYLLFHLTIISVERQQRYNNSHSRESIKSNKISIWNLKTATVQHHTD